MAKTNTKHGTSRAAAQDLQKTACKLYSAITGVPYGSSEDDDAEIKPRRSGQKGVDVVFSPRVRELLRQIGMPDCCECKNEKTWNLQRSIFQAMANTPEGSDWILVLKRRAKLKKDRIDPVVVMNLEAFKELIVGLLSEWAE